MNATLLAKVMALGDQHVIVGDDGLRPFPRMSPLLHAFYDLLLDDPYAWHQTSDVAAVLHTSKAYVRVLAVQLRMLREREGIGTVYARKGCGYSLCR